MKRPNEHDIAAELEITDADLEWLEWRRDEERQNDDDEVSD